MDRLAIGTPVGASCVRPLEGTLNGRLANTAGLVFAAVDPEAVAGVGFAGGAAFAAAIGNDEIG